MDILRKLFGQRPEKTAAYALQGDEQAVIVRLPGSGLPKEIYENYDLSTLEDQLIEAVERSRTGEFDGNEFGAEGVALYLYGSDAEALFAAIESTLRSYPLCQNARVVIRRGPPGSPEREVTLGA